MRQKLNLVTLGVRDLAKSREFYQQGLGWKPSSASQESIVFFDLGGVALALYSREELAADATIAAAGTGFSGLTLAYNAKSEKEVDSVLKEARAAGAALVKAPQKVSWGGYSGYFA
ncbi:MAG: VOC family protein, partial [Anaeromusa sp.]|uniref:VOC family protein n=1 Tax=Anaeromusa sp. TaxID=1872520 RepID=UPI002B21E76F